MQKMVAAIETWQIGGQLLERVPTILVMSAEIDRETATHSQLAMNNVSAIAPAKTEYDWSNTFTPSG